MRRLIRCEGESISFLKLAEKAGTGRDVSSEILRDCLAYIGQRGARTQVRVVVDRRSVGQQWRIFARVIGRARRGIATMIGAEDNQIAWFKFQ
jgi:hypothetical protein